MLDRRLLQEWPVGRAGPLSEDSTARTDLLDVEGWNEDDAGTMAMVVSCGSAGSLRTSFVVG
jgi:hypothetical protein